MPPFADVLMWEHLPFPKSLRCLPGNAAGKSFSVAERASRLTAGRTAGVSVAGDPQGSAAESNAGQQERKRFSEGVTGRRDGYQFSSCGGVEGHAGDRGPLIKTRLGSTTECRYPRKTQKGAALPVRAGEALAGIKPGPREVFHTSDDGLGIHEPRSIDHVKPRRQGRARDRAICPAVIRFKFRHRVLAGLIRRGCSDAGNHSRETIERGVG